MSARERFAIDATLAALADPRRRQVVDILSEKPLAAGELAKAAGLTAPAMSRHLKVLRESGLVEEEHRGFDARVRVYRLRSEPMTALKEWLEEAERHWTRQILAFKAHVEKAKKK